MSNTSKRFRPLCFARYWAASANDMSISASSVVS